MEKAFTVRGLLAVLVGLCWLTSLPARSQGGGLVLFDKLPQTYQLYPRDAQNQAHVPIAGRVAQPGWQYVSVRVFRNNQPFAYQQIPVRYGAGVGTFAAAPVLIRAEKATYNFAVYLVNGPDSVRVANPTGVVAGDVYVMTGQSNASAYFTDTRTNEFCRTFGKNSGTYGTDAYNPADTLWALANQTAPDQNVGATGFAFQQYILDKYGIPTCLINAAAHWSMMLHWAERTAAHPADLTNRYGRLLYRVQKSGLASHVKALIYRQGESEAYGEGTDWPGYFRRFYANLKTDLPAIRQLYVCQIDLIEAGVAAAPAVREAQRALATAYPDIQVLATVGTAGFDGLHYTPEGYSQTGTELARLAGRDFYADTDTDNIDSPNPKQVYFSSPARNELTLLFATNQELVWPASADNRHLIDFFYLNGKAGQFGAGRAAGNRVVLTLNAPAAGAATLTYLPPKGVPFLYAGPYLANKRGMRALSFLDVPLSAPPADVPPVLPAAPVLAVAPVSATALQLTWRAEADVTGFVLEQRTNESGTFRLLAELPATARTYLATGLVGNTAYTYRLVAVRNGLQSAPGLATGTTNPVPVVVVVPPPVLATPVLVATATHATSIRLSWGRVAQAVRYVLERRLASATTFEPLVTLDSTTLDYLDRPVADGTAYTYRLQAVGPTTVVPSARAVADVRTPALLAAPVLSLTVLYASVLRLGWLPVAGATAYELDRQGPSAAFQRLGTFGPATLALADSNLLPGQTYTYRIRAVGNRTDSPPAEATATLPARLATPTLQVNPVSSEALTLSWSVVAGATGYWLERREQDVGTYQAPIWLAANQTDFTDSGLRPNTNYTYRLTAIGEKTSSLPVVAGSTTLILLALSDPLTAASLWPNPAQGTTVLHLSQPVSGRLRVLDSRGIVWSEQLLVNASQVPLALGGYPAGVYLVEVLPPGQRLVVRLVVR